MNREEELNLIKKERDEIEKHMTDMFDLAFMLNNRNDVMNPQAHYEKLSRMVTHYMGSIQQSYGYMSIKVIEALEQEPRKDEVILTNKEYRELLSSEFDNGYAKGYREALEKEPIEVEATKLQMTYNQGFEDCRKAVMDLLSEAGKVSLLAMVADLQSANPQEPKTGHWAHDGSYWKYRFICSECNYRLLDKPTNYCPNCGARMESEGV